MTRADDDSDGSDGLDGLLIEDNTEAQVSALPGLLSPPRGWPSCFTQPAMKAFISGELGGRKVRLSELPPSETQELVAGLPLSPTDPQGNALKVREAFGYDMLGGFALYEKEVSDGAADPYIGKAHWWNVSAKGLWLDFTPRAYTELVLVESSRTAVPPPSTELLARLDGIRAATLREEEARGVDLNPSALGPMRPSCSPALDAM